MTDDDQWPEDWHNSHQVAIAGGIAAVLLIGLLIYAVLQVSDSSVEPPAVPIYPTSSSAVTSATSTTLKTATSSTTSYRSTSVQTSEDTGPADPPPPAVDTSTDSTTTGVETTTASGSAGSI